MLEVRNGSTRLAATDFSVSLQRISQLSALLQNTSSILPIFVRFQQTHQHLTIPVIDVVTDGETLEVEEANGTKHSLKMELLQDIVVFQDGTGKPVFLTEFQTGGDLVSEYHEEIEEGIQHETVSRLKHQDVYLPVNPGMAKIKPMIRKQKKTEKVHRYVVTLRNAIRKAA